MAIDLTLDGASPRLGTARPLFRLPAAAYWDVRADGQAFLVTMPTVEGGLAPINVLMNWRAK